VRRYVLPLLVLAAVSAVLAVPVGARRGAPDSKIVELSFRSHALDRPLHFAVYLPPGYTTSGLRYPVVYFLHGLPAGPTAYRHIDWLRDVLDSLPHKAILVAPQGSADADRDPEYLDWGAGRNWETAVAGELVPVVDRRYRTIATRQGRVLVGVSAGGYGAALIGYHHPGVFSVFQSWSGYFRPTNPSGTAVIDLGSKQANDWASLHAIVPKMRKRLGRWYGSTYFGFFVGTGDSRFLSDNKRLGSEMDRARVPNHVFKTYKGEHSMQLWQQQAPSWIGRALSQAAPVR